MMETLTPQRVGPRTGGWSDSGSKKTIFEDSYMQRIKNKRKQKLAEDEDRMLAYINQQRYTASL